METRCEHCVLPVVLPWMPAVPRCACCVCWARCAAYCVQDLFALHSGDPPRSACTCHHN